VHSDCPLESRQPVAPEDAFAGVRVDDSEHFVGTNDNGPRANKQTRGGENSDRANW
jgi:hypothetical protein